MRFGTVGGALAGEVVLLHDALKAFAFGAADDINEIAGLKLSDAEVDLPFRQIGLEAEFTNQFLRFQARLLEFAQTGLGQTRFFLWIESNLGRRIAVLFRADPA